MRNVRLGIRDGLVFGAVFLFVVLVGLYGAFAANSLLGVRVPNMIFALFGIWVGAYVMRSVRRQGSQLTDGVVAALVAGVTMTLLLALFTFWASRVNLRDIFANMTPEVVALLTFDRGVPTGLVFQVVGGALLAVAGALGNVAWDRIRLPEGATETGNRLASFLLVLYVIVGGFTALLFALGQWGPALRDIAEGALGFALPNDLYRILRIGAVVLIVGYLGGIALTLAAPAQAVRLKERLTTTRRLFGLAFILLALFFPLSLGSYWNQVLTTIGIFVMMGLGLNVVVGFAGLLDLGYVAFFAIGAYTYAFLNSPKYGLDLSFWVSLPIAMAVAALAGIILGVPVLRMRGDYLAIVTLGFGEIIRLIMNNQVELTGGAQGILQIQPPEILGLVINTPLRFYYLIFIGAVLVAFVTARLNNSRIGRAWIAMREDEDVAQAMGINTVNYKLLAFATGAAFAGLAGLIFAARQRNIFPADFGLLVSIEALSLIIIGGMGSIPGVIAGAVALKGLPELLRALQEYRLLIYGALLVVMMLVRPEGLLPSRRRAREIHEAMEEIEIDESELQSTA
nr:hypothetical protein [Ardenticatena sp.]